jgi:malonyl-CoA/methylmalonyl-CoA synthetase
LSEGKNITLLDQISLHSSRTAIAGDSGEHSYAQLINTAHGVASGLLKHRTDLEGARIAFLAPPSFDYVAVLLGIWAAGGIAVPVGLNYPAPEIEYILLDSEAELVVTTPNQLASLGSIEAAAGRIVPVEPLLQAAPNELPKIHSSRNGLILYTSGTTSRPKGVVITHRNISSQIRSLVAAWGWKPEDRILNVLPLHHVHGIVNVLLSALWTGATCQMVYPFKAGQVFRLLSSGDFTLFMAVPTIYVKLIEEWTRTEKQGRRNFSEACRKMRLMVSGSAALPVQVLKHWEQISGHTLLERYGMTEIGMALSNPLHGERRPGYVGTPLPGVEVKLVDENRTQIHEEGIPGEIYVRGASVFNEYWRKPEATRSAFHKGWFRTGDIAVAEKGYYRIQGRDSVDIIKTGGYKVSALEIEEVLRTHDKIRDCAVVGVEDAKWGEKVAVAAILEPGESMDLEELRQWAAEKLARQKIPSILVLPDDFPRNAMGKIVKPELKRLIQEGTEKWTS